MPQETGFTVTEWVEVVTNIVNAVAVLVGVGLALLGLNAWRREMTGRRNADLAEATLAAFYEAQDYLTWVRLGVSFGGEGASRPGRENDEDSQQTFKLDAYYTVIERLKGQSEFWSRFQASRYRFRALFGDTSNKPFENIRRVRDDVIGAAQDLRDLWTDAG